MSIVHTWSVGGVTWVTVTWAGAVAVTSSISGMQVEEPHVRMTN
jgi:hypothetical protein